MKNILCFGDSNTWGYDASTYDPALGSGQRMPFDVRWPGRVQNILGSDYRIIEDALNAPNCYGRGSIFHTPSWYRKSRNCS